MNQLSIYLLSLVVLNAASQVYAAGAANLNGENFVQSISGKNAFVKFLAPW